MRQVRVTRRGGPEGVEVVGLAAERREVNPTDEQLAVRTRCS